MTKEEKCSATQVGRIVIHKESIEKRVYPSEVNDYLNDGWEIGISEVHRKSQSEKHLGHTPWNKGTVGVMKSNKTSFAVGNIPWNKGKKGVQSSTRKGLTKETSESIRNTSILLKKSWENNDERRRQQSERAKNNKGRILSPNKLQEYLEKCDATKRKNNSFNTSKPEDEYYKYLCSIYGVSNVRRNYRDKERYNHRCDFYIISEDLFIELNLHWTHGRVPFNPNDEFCINQLNIWKEKAKTSKFYENAINTWTVLDVNKLKDAKKSGINYLVIYPNKPIS